MSWIQSFCYALLNQYIFCSFRCKMTMIIRKSGAIHLHPQKGVDNSTYTGQRKTTSSGEFFCQSKRDNSIMYLLFCYSVLLLVIVFHGNCCFVVFVKELSITTVHIMFTFLSFLNFKHRGWHFNQLDLCIV